MSLPEQFPGHLVRSVTDPAVTSWTCGVVCLEERRDLRCEKCGQSTRTVVYVSDNGDLKASLEGCRVCCSGIYATPVED